MANASPHTFVNADGHELSARLDLPSGPPRACALFAHCFTCSKDIAAATRISRALTDHGFAVLRFDFTGLGHSGGEFANTDFSGNVSDILCATGYLREHYGAPRVLIGHSLGGAAVLAAAGQIPEATAVCTIGAPSDPAHVAHLFADHQEVIESEGCAQVQIAGRQFSIRREFLEDLADQRLVERIRKMGKALLVFHSPVDQVVAVEHARHIYDAAKHPKSFVSLDNADHLLSRRADARYVASVIAAWADRYVPLEEEPEEMSSAAIGQVVVETDGHGKFSNTVFVGAHRFTADEPRSVGGDDRGPTPYDLLLAALGTCTSMTMKMYADRKGWPLDGVRVALDHEKVHAKDCETCDQDDPNLRIDRIQRRLEIKGDLTPDQVDRIVRIADKCPVHRTLHGPVQVDTDAQHHPG